MSRIDYKRLNMFMYKIIETTDDKFLGIRVNINSNPIILKDFIFYWDDKKFLDNGITVLSNSNYIISLESIDEK